jgi:hypothetical protein
MSQRKVSLRMRILELVFLAVATVAPVLPVGARAQTEAPLYNYPAIYGNTSSIGYPGILAQGTDGNLYTTMQG